MSAAIITHGAETYSPAAVTGYAEDSESASIVHVILGRPDPDITQRPALLRSGTLTLVFSTEADSAEAFHGHRETGTFAIIAPDFETVEMTYVVAGGRITRRRERSGEWIVSVPFQEVTP
jgi:hypothetical protein